MYTGRALLPFSMPRASGLSEYRSWLSRLPLRALETLLEMSVWASLKVISPTVKEIHWLKSPFKQFYGKNMEWREGKEGRSGGLGLAGKVGRLGGSQTRPRHGNRPNLGRIGVDSPDWGFHGVPGTEGDPGRPNTLTVSLWKSSNRPSVSRRDPLCALSPLFVFVRSTAQGRRRGVGKL